MCEKCNFTTAQKFHLKKHIKVVHEKEKDSAKKYEGVKQSRDEAMHYPNYA